jgi:hypothetical protein
MQEDAHRVLETIDTAVDGRGGESRRRLFVTESER